VAKKEPARSVRERVRKKRLEEKRLRLEARRRARAERQARRQEKNPRVTRMRGYSMARVCKAKGSHVYPMIADRLGRKHRSPVCIRCGHVNKRRMSRWRK